MPRRKSFLTEATPENGETQRDIKLNKDLVNEKGDSIPDPTELVVNEEDGEEEDEPPEAKKIRLDEDRKDLLINEQLCVEESRDAAPPTGDNDKGDNFSMDSHKIKVVETPAVANLETVSELAVGSIESASQLTIGSVETISQLEKRNLSLEALCEVGSSELQNIQRQGSPSTPQNHESTSNLSSSQESNSGASSTKIKIVNPEDIRKRKHPAKPGKHICTFCGRGCAKPSVLEKHLRAHTGERPFPCLDCGFAFKTKSNLYKHCKSRSHALKVKLGRKVKQWSSQEETDNDDVDEYDDEGLNDSQSSTDTLDREEISLTPNEAEQITLLNDMSKFLKKVDSEPTKNDLMQKEDSFENREQAPVHVLQEVAKYLEKPKAERPRIEVPSWKSDARPRFETRMRNLNLEFEQNKNLAQGGKKQSVVDEQKLNSAQSQFITIAPKQDLSRALSTGTEITDQLATIHKMGSGGSVTVHRLLLPAMALPNMETMSAQSSNTSISNVAADKVIAIDNGTGAVEVIRLPHPNTDPSTANQALRELESLSERVQQSSGSEVQLVPAVVELQDGTCQVSVKAVPARENHAPLVRSFSQPAGEMKTKTQGDSRVDMEKVKERIQNLISSNAAIVKSPLFEYKRLYRQNSESKGSVQKSFSITKSDSLQSEHSISTEEKIVTSTTVIKPDGTEKSVSISIPSVIQKDTSKTTSETKPETVTTRRLVRQSALTSSDNVEAKPQVSSGSSLNVLTISNEILKQIAEANSSGAPKPNPSGANRTQEIASKTVTALDHSGKEITIKLQLENPVTTDSVKPTKESSDGQSKAIKDKIREVIKARDIPPPVTKSLSESTINIPLKDKFGNITSVSVSNLVKSSISVEKKEQFECDFCKNAFHKKETLDLHMAYYCTYIKAHDSIDKSKVLQMFHKTESEKRPMEGLVKRQISLPVIQFPRQVSTSAITRTSLTVRPDSIGVIKSTDSGLSKQLSLPMQFSGGVINISSASIPSVAENVINKKGRPKLIERQPRISLPSTHPLPSTHALPHTPITGSMYPLNQIASVVPTQLQTMLGGPEVKSPHPSVITSHQTRAANNKATPLPVTFSATPYSSQSLPKPAPEVQQPVIIQNVMSVNKALIFPDNQKEQTEVHVDKQVSSAPVTDVHSMIQVQIVGPLGGEMLRKPTSLQPVSMVQLVETPQPNTIIVHKHPDAKQKDKHFIHSSSDSSEHSSPHILNEDLKEKLKGKLLMKRSLSLDPKVLQLSGSSKLLKEEDADPPANKKIKLVTVTLPVTGGDIAPSTALELEPKAWRIQTLTIPVVRAQPMYQLSQMDSHLMFIDKSSQSSGISSFLAEQNLMKMDSAKAISVTASGAQSTEKGGTVSVPLILFGHNYPSLRMSTQVSFCCVSRPQPMYVPLKSNKKISMYSNWKVSGHNTNPIGLTPKMLFSLYRSDFCKDPSYTTAYSQASKGGMSTHSSYWTYKEKKTGAVQSEKKPEVKKEEDTDTPISSTKVTTPKKVTGGIKSLDPYVYVRGRGRGKYICNECGIRCKKPSMLKKHIRSHTNLRPYVCWHCHFSFKTKGNLTKHMKSKSHHKKCLELGIVPVPTQVDESQIDQQMLKAQCDLSKKARIVLKDGASISVDLDEINSESDDDEEEDEEDIQDQESMDTQDIHQEIPDVVIEINVNTEEMAAAQEGTTHVPDSPKSSLEGIERGLLGSNPVICSMIQPHPNVSQGPHPLGRPEGDIAHQRELQTVQELSNSSQRIIHMEEESSSQHASLGTIYGFPTEATTVDDHLSTNMVEITEVYISEGDPKLGFLFEELRKHKTELQTRNTNSPPSDEQSKKNENQLLPLVSNIDEVKEADNSGKKNYFDSRETVSVSLDKNLDTERTDTEVTVGKSTSPSATDVNATAHLSVIGSISSPSKGTTQEVKKAKVEPPRQLEFSIPLGGFMPPHAFFKQPKQSNSGPIIGQLIRQRPVNLQFSSPVKTPTSQATPICAPFQFHHPFIEKHDSQDINALSNSDSSERVEESETQNKTLSEEKLKVTNVDSQEEEEEDYHSYIIIESSEGQTVDALSPEEVRGEQVLYQCQFCEDLIEPEHILNHLKIHKMEHRYPCETCGVVFPSKEKFKNHTHEKSVSAKSNPEMCDMCQQSFTSSDELSQHFKTKTHIDKLEELGVVPKDTFPNIERNMESLSTSDHEEFVELLKSKIASRVESTEHSHSPTQFQGQPQFEKNPSASSDKVTVEIKQESSDFCQMTSASSDYSPERGVSPNMPHLCEICRRGFINLEHLKAHLVSHAEIRPYVCEYCDAGFTNSQSLKTHLLSHAQERPYVCGYCGETFPISSDLKKHAEILHKISSTMMSKANVDNNEKSPTVNSGGSASDSLHSDQTRSSLKAKGADSNPD